MFYKIAWFYYRIHIDRRDVKDKCQKTSEILWQQNLVLSQMLKLYWPWLELTGRSKCIENYKIKSYRVCLVIKKNLSILCTVGL